MDTEDQDRSQQDDGHPEGVPVRADLASIPSYVPGRTVAGAIKLASNEVSGEPLPSVLNAITEAAKEINRYPDSGSSALASRLAARHGVAQSRIAVGCGSVTLCQQLVQSLCTPVDEVLFAWRSFEMYPIVPQVAGVGQRRIPLTSGHVHDLEAMAEGITPATRLVFVCNPNNPTSTAVRRAELETFLDAVPEHVLVVLDEAYREFVDDEDVPDGIAEFAGRPNVAVLRTFSKAYGLAGLRVGYCVAPPDVADALRKVFVPFGVNRLAQAAAEAALDAEAELMERVREVVGERSRVSDALREAGFEVPESQANFVWLPLGDRAGEFAEHCVSHKVIVRPFAGDGVRVTIGTQQENDTFLEAARTWRS